MNNYSCPGRTGSRRRPGAVPEPGDGLRIGDSAPQALDLETDYKARPKFGADGLGHVMAAWHEDGICCGEFSDTYGSIWLARWRY